METDAYYRLNRDGFFCLKNITSLLSYEKCLLVFSNLSNIMFCTNPHPPSEDCVNYGIVVVPFLSVEDRLLAPGDSHPLIIPGFTFPGVTFVLTRLIRWSLKLRHVIAC